MALEREQVPANRKWRTEDIFATQEDWEALYGKVEAAVAAKPGFAAYQGKLTDAATVLECMDKLNAIMLDVIRLDVYAFMRGDEDTRKSEFVALKSRMSQLEMKLAAETAFITPELTSLPAETLEAFAADPRLSDYDYTLRLLIKEKPHILSQETEEVLSQGARVFDSSRQIFGMLDNADSPPSR